MNRSSTFAHTGSSDNGNYARVRARKRMLLVLLTVFTVPSRASAQTSPASTAPPATGQQELPVPRYVGTNAGQWERWDLNARLNGAAPITPQLAAGSTSSGGLNSTGRLSTSCIANPAAPTAVQTGIAGTTTLSYFLVCHDSNGGATLASSATTITNANAALNSSNYVLISWPAVAGCVSWDVLKGNTSTALTTGVSGLAVSDTGQATTPYRAPAANTTCDIFSGGNVTGTVNGVINVATYGAECDARQGTDGSTTAGSTTFSSASGAFNSSDVGKIIDPSQSGVALGTTIVAILSPTSVQMSSAATATTTSAYWTAGTDNTAAINASLAAVPASVTGGDAVYTPSVNPARPGWTGRCLIKNGVTILKQGTFLIGDGPYVSIWQCSTGMTNDCVTIAGFTTTPVGVRDMGIISDLGGNGTNACLTLSGDAGIFVDRNWFQGCLIGLNVANTSSYHITNNVSELSQINYQFTGTSAPGVLLGNESYHNNSGGKGFYFNGVSAAQKLVADANFDTGTTGNIPGYGSGLFVLNSSDLDLGTFVDNYSNVVAGPLTISNSARIRLRPIIHNMDGPFSMLVDFQSSDIQIIQPDIDNSFAAASTTLSANLGSGDTTATVASTTNFPPPSGLLFVDAEQINYSGLTGTTFTGLTRGVNGTTAASHSSGATIKSQAAKLFLPPGPSNVSASDVVVTGIQGQNLVPGLQYQYSTWPALDTNEPIVNAAGQFGDAAFVYTGTGSAAPSTNTQSPNIPVTTGEVVTFSGYIDATNVTAGSPGWCIWQGVGGILASCVKQAPGDKGRVATNYVVPAGVSNLAIGSTLNGATVTSAKTLVFSSPQVVSGWYPIAYTAPSPAGGSVLNSCAGVVTLSGGAGTFSNSCVSAASHCTANDQSAANPVKVAVPAAGSVALAGTGTDGVMVVCQ